MQPANRRKRTSFLESPDRRDRMFARCALWAILASYLVLLLWRVLYWSSHSHPISVNGYLVDNLLKFLIFEEINEPTLAVAAFASIAMRLHFDGAIVDLLEEFTRRHPEDEPHYRNLLVEFESLMEGKGHWLWTVVLTLIVPGFATLFHHWFPDVGLTDPLSLGARLLWALSLIWVLWWPFAASRKVLRPLLRDAGDKIQPLHPDHCGGMAKFGTCMLRTSSPLLATLLLLVSWMAVPLFSDDYSPEFAEAVLVLFLVCGLPMLVYVLYPLWRLHQLLEGAKVASLEDLWPPTLRQREALAVFAGNREAIAYIKSMSTWPLGSATPFVLLLASQAGAAFIKFAPKIFSRIGNNT